MRVLLVGSGGREHALAWKLAQSRQLSSLYATPGNPGIAHHATLLHSPQDPAALTELAVRHSIDLVVIGPEQPLVDGLVDRLAERGIRAFGPHKAAARLEGSKRFAKEFMARHGIPTAASEAFTEEQAALDFLSGLSEPPVVKLSGLAAGKGVTVSGSMAEARQAVQAAFARSAGDGVVIEERLSGRELSLLAITDSHTWLPLKLARDYKYLLDGDRGPMTGGMGAVAPASLLSPAEEEQISSGIVDRTLQGLRAEGLGFAGVLFIGLMVTDSGVKVLEYNVRFGDPETQSVLPLLDSDLLEAVSAAADGRLEGTSLSWQQKVAAGVVLAAPGYPAEPQRGIPLVLPEQRSDLLVFQAGTELREGRLYSSGGRVLNVVALGADLGQARARAYEAVRETDFQGAQWRSDVGLDLAGR